MVQSSLLKKDGIDKFLAAVTKKLRIKVPHFDNSVLVQRYAKTLIGRCMNHGAQSVNNLLFMLAQIWNVEGIVSAADLGLGRFQFDFDNEEDIVEILKMEPFHFDHWMVSLVRWKTRVCVEPHEANYPYDITLWVRVLGVPLHYWAYPKF